MATPEMTADDVALVVNKLTLEPGAAILDAPCGSGRHSIAFAGLGHRVTGIDISAEAITFARREAAAEGVDVSFQVGDMRSVPMNVAFDAAVCLGNSFGYLDIIGTKAFLAALARAIRPGGGLVIDANIAAETILPGFTGEARTMRAGDITVEATTEYDVTHSRLISHYHYTRGAEQWAGTALHHLYTVAHIRELLTDAGFDGIELYDGPDGRPYRLGAHRLLVVARRR
ncbi:methyltransferase domain-containing protein [Nakamurella sp. GG22]